MTATDTVTRRVRPAARPSSESRLGSWWVIVAVALSLLLVLGWRFIADPSLSAPTRDPAWYTWRANVILDADPGSVAGEWGPEGLFSGGYRITVPLAGALLQRVAGIDTYSFSAFLMIGLPILTGMALGVGAFRSRRDPLAMLVTMLATVALFLTTPYVGYLDNITVLFLLSLTLPFLHSARTSWGARAALFLIAFAASFTHPTTCVIFGVVLVAVFGFHFLTSRFSLGSALRSDAPMLMSVGFGMMVGYPTLWILGIWGTTGNWKDAALPPPYTKDFFVNRLSEWVLSMQPIVIVPFIVIAIASTILLARRERKPAHTFDMTAIWWMLAFVGTLSFLTGAVVPYYRFMNASAAPMALAGLGAFVAIRWFLRLTGPARVAGVLASVLVVGALGWVTFDGLQHRWVSESNQWANQQVRASLAAVNEVVTEAGPRPIVLVVNYNDLDDEFGTNTAYGWAKTYTNVFRTGLPGDLAKYQATYLGTVENFFQDQRATVGLSDGYTEASLSHAQELRSRLREYSEQPPVVFLVGQYYGGLCNGIQDCTDAVEQQRLDEVLAQGTEVGPDVFVLNGEDLYAPPADVVERASLAARTEAQRFADHPGALANPLHNLFVLFGLFLLVVLPGLLAAPFFELEDTPSRLALIPGMGIVLTLVSGIAVLTVWRGALTTAKGWTVVGVAALLGAGLRFGRRRVLKPLEAFGGFFNGMFAVFSDRSFAALMGVQFVIMAADGVIRGSIAKSIAFGGQKGFDVTTVPSARYLLLVVLALYVPYTFLSPFIGVVIDRFERRRVLAVSSIITAVATVVVALSVLAPLGKDETSADRPLVTAGLILAMLVVQACVRIMLAVKSAALPSVLSGKDLLQGNGLSQAGGALFQVVGAGFAFGAAGMLPAWLVVAAGAGLLVVAAVVAKRIERMETAPHTASFGQEAKRVVHDIVAGVKEVGSRPPAALALSSFQMLRYQFWGFTLFVFALYARSLVAGGDADIVALGIVGGGGFMGGAIGLVLAQKIKDRVAPIRLLLAAMTLLGAGSLVFGPFVSLVAFAAMLFFGFFAFFVGKISADTIMQQAMPDDFRGRAFALFDIAYNLGFIVPALILFLVWSDSRVRPILMISGAVFLLLTLLVARWASRIQDRFAPQDDLIEVGGEQAIRAE